LINFISGFLKNKNFLLYSILAILIFIVSWYIAIKFAIVLIAAVIGFFAGFSYKTYKDGKKTH
jgi:hypothetical protein